RCAPSSSPTRADRDPGQGPRPLMDALIVFCTAALVTALAVPVAGRVSRRIGAIALPDDRRVHERPTPTLGGAAMLVGVLASFAVAWRLGGYEEVFEAPT